MSLNGLDHVSVTQAYQGALAEAGGWFLLKYTSRDAVEVLTRGTGGAGEARAAVAQYEEKSPLYGFMLYRRRKVLVKYVPDGTSRLLQARVAVHFITVTERFAPHDIVLNISTAEELSDAALTAACTLHTAAPSSSSSSGSSRQQKLSWIQEAAEEGSQPGGDDTTSRPTTARANIPTIIEPTSIDEMPERTMSVVSDGAESVPLILEEKVAEAKPAKEISHVTIETVTEAPKTPDTEPESDLADMQETLKSYDKLFEGGPEPRSSTQTARPNYDELYEHYYAQYAKPKVKLGPRPRPSLEGKRPSTSGSVPQVASRPKSSLPAGLRSSTKKAADQRAAKSRETSSPPTLAIPPVPPIPDTAHPPSSPTSLIFTARSPASVRSMPVSGYSSHIRSMGNTQEKTRLMKALEMRKKQQKAQVERQEKIAEQAAAQETEARQDEETTAADDVVENTKSKPDVETDSGKSFTTTEVEADTDVDEEPSSQQLDNAGLTFSSNHTDTDDLHSTASVSSPISAQAQGSSGAPSTRPSSLSDDDTPVQEECSSDSAQDTQDSDVVDEEQSVDSAPTVVLENRTPVPSLIHPSPLADDSTPSNDEEASRTGATTAQTDAQAIRRSKRESTLYVPPGDTSPLDDAMFKQRTRESIIMPNAKRESWYETKEKRRALLDPLQVSAENSEAEYLSDDSFMEELQTATVHQAKPMSVSKSPITPWFPRKSSNSSMATTPERAVSHTFVRKGRLSPEQLPRKTSGPWPPQVSPEKVGTSKKVNVSTGISQRIKALAEKSNRESSSSPPSTPNTPFMGKNISSTSLAQRKSSFFATAPLDTSPNGKSVTRLGAPSFLSSAASSMSDKKSVTPKPVKATVYNVQKANQQPESVQVTARIVRDERTIRPTLAMPTESTPLDLHQSPLIIDHQKPNMTPKSPERGRAEVASSKAPSTSHSREQSNGPPRTSSESSWRAFGRRMSESKSIHSHEGDEKREDKKDKKESRTSKMFKRMSSSMSSMPWKNSSNLTLPENDMRTTSLASLREPPPPVHIGDLNIQFPDTLLWRRRWVEIDSMGNLVMSPSKSNEKGIVKRFHLSEFRTPYPPDQDRQELPNSVVLDFIDGRTLQCACETYMAQAQVLQVLREAHDAWLAYSQAS